MRTWRVSSIAEMDLFAFVDIIGIRAIGFPAGLTFRSLRITFLPERSSFSPKGKSIIPVRLPCVYAYARERVFSASADNAESSCCEFGNGACHWLSVDLLLPLVKKNGLIIRRIIYPLDSFIGKNSSR